MIVEQLRKLAPRYYIPVVRYYMKKGVNFPKEPITPAMIRRDLDSGALLVGRRIGPAAVAALHTWLELIEGEMK